MKVKNDVNEELKFQSNLFSINYDGTCGKREHKLEYWIFIRFFLNFILYENQCFCCVYMCCKFVCSLIFLSYILLSKCNFPFDNDFNVCSDNFKQKSALFFIFMASEFLIQTIHKNQSENPARVNGIIFLFVSVVYCFVMFQILFRKT